jgi:ArsR family transcriptional regulator
VEKPLGRDALKLIADRFKLLSCATRLEILQLLCRSERSVGEIVRETGYKQANVSRNLALLDRAGFVRRRTEGAFVHYSLAQESLPRLCEIMQDCLRASQAELSRCL